MTETPIRHFLLVFDHDLGKLVSQEEFDSSDEAVAAYAAKEQAAVDKGGADRFEIVLIGSDSLDTVKLTHANYFDGSVAGSKYLIGI
jgi:hypothetical protein